MPGRRRFLVALGFEAGLEAEVNGLRRALGSSQLERIPPHVTIVPPTNVAADEVASMFRTVADAASALAPFEVTIGPPATFPDNRSVLFLSVSDADEALEALRSALLKGPFAQRREAGRAFVPHVTLYSRRAPAAEEPLLSGLSSYRVTTTIADLALLEQDDAAPTRPWRVLCRVDLGTATSLERAGRRILFCSGASSAAFAAALCASWGIEITDVAGESEPRSIVVALDGEVAVAVATFAVTASRARLCLIAVEPTVRSLGIGTAVLGYLEHVLVGRGVDVVVCAPPRDGGLARVLSRRGWVELPDPLEEVSVDHVLLARRISRLDA